MCVSGDRTLLKILDNGIRLLRTQSPEDTALWLHVLARQEQRRVEHRATVRIGRRPIVASPVGLLSAIPGSVARTGCQRWPASLAT